MRAEVRLESQESRKYSAYVIIVDRVIDAASGTFGVRLELPNPDYRVPAGLMCKVVFPALAGLKHTPQQDFGETLGLSSGRRLSRVATGNELPGWFKKPSVKVMNLRLFDEKGYFKSRHQ